MDRKPVDYGQYSILVIEDQPFVRRTIMQILSQIGFRSIAEADNGETGMQECIRTAPDVIVCDIDMKPVSGLQFLAELRASAEVRNRRTPVVFLTNHTESEIVKKAMALGVNGFGVKPPSFGALKERVDRLLDRGGLWAVVGQRFVPGINDALASYVFGAFGVPLWQMAAGAFIGSAPKAFVYTAVGASLGEFSAPLLATAIVVWCVTAVLGAFAAHRGWRHWRDSHQ